MLGFFKDSALTLPVSLGTPKRFLLPLKGGSQATSLFIGDPYTARVTAQAAVGATSIALDQTFELPAPGLLTVGAQTILYTSKTPTSVTGIPATGTGSITSIIAAGTAVAPKLVYQGASTLRVDPFGVDLSDVSVQMKRSNQTAYSFPNTPVLYTQSTISPGVANAVEVDVLLSLIAGAQQEFSHVSLIANTFTCAENLVTFSEQADNPAWALSNNGGVTGAPTVVANAALAPDGVSLTADQITFPTTDAATNATISQTVSIPVPTAGTFYSFSVWLRAAAPVNNLIICERKGGGLIGAVPLNQTTQAMSITTAWQQFTISGDVSVDATATIAVGLRLTPSQTGCTVFAWGWQVNHGTTPATYVQTTSLPQPGRAGDVITLTAPLYVFRRDQALPQSVRLLPTTRQVSDTMPGFVLGQYRWRGPDTINESTIVPTAWDQDTAAIGIEKFATGTGHGDSLEPAGLSEVEDSIYMSVTHGTYFDGPSRFYFPAGSRIEFFAASGPAQVDLVLDQKPNPQIPIFVGTWKLDAKGFYTIDTQYRYMIGGFDTTAGAPAYQFTLDRPNQTISINQGPPKKILYLGTISGNQTDFFDLPLYPVDRVNRVYIDRGVTGLALDSTNWTFDRDNGSVQVINPNSATQGPAIPNALTGEAVFAEIETAVAVEYEVGTSTSVVVDTVDINPAFSGLAGGHYYMQHRRQKADTIQLLADKPTISIPPSLSSVAGLTAYGPVYFDGDYALLIAKAYSKIPGESIPGVRMRAVIDPTVFTGLLNYRNPVALITAASRVSGVTTYTAANGFQAGDVVTITNLTTSNFNGRFTVLSATTSSFTVGQAQADASISNQGGFAVIDIDIVTGGDGTANAVYIPQSGFGYYLPTTAAQTPVTATSLGGVKTTTIANDTLVLPTTVPISQVRNNQEGWLVNLYSVESNNPLFGLLGGNTANGEVPFTTSGTAGSVGYRTNGVRELWSSGTSPGSGAAIVPIDALDVNGVSYTGGGFTGLVKQLKYATALPTPTALAAYFVTFLQRVQIQFEALDSNAISNSVLLQMAVPAIIIENPWLRIEDDTQGRINQYRLGWVPPSLAGPQR